MRYWIDWAGRLWRGPVNPDDNLHYATFEGYMTSPPYNTIWVLRRSDPPNDDVEEVSAQTALRAISLFWPLPRV